MTTARSFQNQFEMTDYTDVLVTVPNTWGLVNSLNIFENEGVTQRNITVELQDQSLAVIPDTPVGVRNNVNRDDNRRMAAFMLTHHTLDDVIKPEDLQGKRAYGSADAVEIEANVLDRRMKRIRKNHAVTLEAARCYTLTTGMQYSPGGTVTQNFYSTFGITRKEVDFVLGTAGTEVNEKSEEIISSIQDESKTGDMVGGITALCSPAFFAKLIKHAKIVQAYQYYQSVQEPLRQRLGGADTKFRTFFHGGVTFIEYRGSFNGVPLIPVGDAYFFPTEGVEGMFNTYFGPANKLSLVNTVGEEAYMWSYRAPDDSGILIQTESNFLNLLRKPQMICRGFSSN
jgi:hypothetical protein